jgi:hypothetical protein
MFGTTSIINAASSWAVTIDTVDVNHQYFYREIRADYDSVSVLCAYGEMNAVDGSSDSTVIQFVNAVRTSNTYFEGTIDSVNYKCTTTPVLLGAQDNICFFRSMAVLYNGPTQADTQLPDTLTWVTHVINKTNGMWLGTIDSVCLLRKDTGAFCFPEYTGTFGSNSFDVVSVGASTIPGATDGDSVYLAMKMSSSGTSNQYSYTDYERWETKFSEYMNMGKKADSELNAAVPNRYSMSVHPNPTSGRLLIDIHSKDMLNQHAEIYLMSIDGRKLGTIHSDNLVEGINRCAYNLPGHLSAGTYLVTAVGRNGELLSSAKVSLVK